MQARRWLAEAASLTRSIAGVSENIIHPRGGPAASALKVECRPMAGLSGTIKARPRGFTLPGKGRQAWQSSDSGVPCRQAGDSDPRSADPTISWWVRRRRS